MEEFNDILEEMDFDFFSTGEHGMSVEAMRHAIGNDHFFFLASAPMKRLHTSPFLLPHTFRWKNCRNV